MKEKTTDIKDRALKILNSLEKAYPDARCSLDHKNTLELLVATILSAQCTDVLVNKVTPELFRKYKNAKDYARASLTELEKDVSRVNFYRNKARSIQEACSKIETDFKGEVPGRMEDLLTLRGVARKTANVVLGNGFGIQEGIVVDTHVIRLSQRMQLSRNKDRDKIEQDLMNIVPKKTWTKFSHMMIFHGRKICKAKSPLCSQCVLGKSLCPSYIA